MRCKPVTFRLEVMCLISSILGSVSVTGKVGGNSVNEIILLSRFTLYQEFFMLGKFRNISED